MLADFYGRSVGSGQCVALVQQAAGVGHTSTWSPGDQVVGNNDLTIGTPIATFDPDGRYGNHTDHTSHAAIYLGPGEVPGSIRVLDQWKGHAASERTIRPDGRSPVDQSGNYRVVLASNQRQVPGYGGGGQQQPQPQSNPEYDDLERELRGPGGALESGRQPTAPAPAAQPAQPGQDAPPSGQYDQLEQELRGPGGAPESQQQTANATPAAQPETPPMINIPALHNFATGVVQGVRDVGSTMQNVTQWADQHVPFLGAVDRFMGATPENVQADINQLATQRQANEQQYGNSLAFKAGRLYGQIGTTLPISEAAGPVLAGAGSVMRAVPLLNRLVTPLTSSITSGAAQGTLAAGATSGGSDEPIGTQLLVGAGGGSLVGGAGWLANKLITPFRTNTLADTVVQKWADGGPTTVNAAEIVPGSKPTLAQATGNAGLATLERGVQSVRSTPFEEIAKQNNLARSAAFDAVKGDQQSLQDLIDLRTQTAAQNYPAAFGNAKPTDPTPVIQEIDQILQSPSGQRDIVQSTLGRIRNKLTWETTDPATGQTVTHLQQDPAQLYGVRQALTDMLSPLSQGDAANARLASRELSQVKDALDPVIEQGAPGYKQFLSDYAAMSKPIDTQAYLQRLNVTDAQGNITLAKMDSALKRIEQQRAMPGPRDAKSIPDAVMNDLYNIREDLRRAGNSKLGMPPGTNTFQNFATNALLSEIGAPLASGIATFTHGPIPGAAIWALRQAYKAQDQKVLDAVVNRLIDPSLGAAALANQGGQNFLVGPAAPVAAAIAANRRLQGRPAADQ